MQLIGRQQTQHFHFSIKEFDDSSSGLYVCKVTLNDQVVEGYVQAQIFGTFLIVDFLFAYTSNVEYGEEECVIFIRCCCTRWFNDSHRILEHSPQYNNIQNRSFEKLCREKI